MSFNKELFLILEQHLEEKAGPSTADTLRTWKDRAVSGVKGAVKGVVDSTPGAKGVIAGVKGIAKDASSVGSAVMRGLENMHVVAPKEDRDLRADIKDTAKALKKQNKQMDYENKAREKTRGLADKVVKPQLSSAAELRAERNRLFGEPEPSLRTPQSPHHPPQPSQPPKIGVKPLGPEDSNVQQSYTKSQAPPKSPSAPAQPSAPAVQPPAPKATSPQPNPNVVAKAAGNIAGTLKAVASAAKTSAKQGVAASGSLAQGTSGRAPAQERVAAPKAAPSGPEPEPIENPTPEEEAEAKRHGVPTVKTDNPTETSKTKTTRTGKSKKSNK